MKAVTNIFTDSTATNEKCESISQNDYSQKKHNFNKLIFAYIDTKFLIIDVQFWKAWSARKDGMLMISETKLDKIQAKKNI